MAPLNSSEMYFPSRSTSMGTNLCVRVRLSFNISTKTTSSASILSTTPS